MTTEKITYHVSGRQHHTGNIFRLSSTDWDLRDSAVRKDLPVAQKTYGHGMDVFITRRKTVDEHEFGTSTDDYSDGA